MPGAGLPAVCVQKHAAAAAQKDVRMQGLAKTCAVRLKKNIAHCYECSIFCGEGCRKGMLAKIKPYGFSLFAARYGEAALLDCLARNERNGVVYHRSGVVGDYDGFTDAEFLVRFIKTGTYTA